MKQLKSNVSNLAVLAVILLMPSCKKSESMSMTEKNIDYPAAYVVNGESSTISVIKLSTNTVTDSIDLMNSGGSMIMWPHHIYHRQSGGNHHLAIGVPGMDLSAGHTGGMSGMKGMVIVMNAITGKIIKNLEVPVMNHNAVFSPDGNEIWTSQMDMSGKVLVYDAETYALKNTITVGDEPAEVTFSADGTKAYVCNGMSNTVSVINPSSKAVLTTINVGMNPVGAWPSAIGKMFVDNEDGQTVSVIDVASNTNLATIMLGFKPGYASLNATNNELWVSDATNGKVVYYKDMGANTWMKHGEFATGADAHAIVFNGNFGYVTNQGANTVSVINITTHLKIKDIPVGKKPNGIVLKY
ncbi:MAG: YncE family protein [Ferruginibacter sp.]|nr:YncE family protein [Ferruginibacter sp.]